MALERPSELDLQLLNLQVHRLSHMETLLVGLATLASAGWAFLHQVHAQYFAEMAQGAKVGFSLFSILFSCLVGSAYNSLFMGRMGINRNVLLLEDVLNPSVKPYRRFYDLVGRAGSGIVFLIPALLLPLMSLMSIGFTVDELTAAGLDDQWKVIVTWFVGAVSAGLILFTTYRSLGLIRQTVAEIASESVSEHRESSRADK